jgi:hypothetical protein
VIKLQNITKNLFKMNVRAHLRRLPPPMQLREVPEQLAAFNTPNQY